MVCAAKWITVRTWCSSQHAAHQRGVADVAYDQRHVAHGLPEPGGQVVDDDDRLAALAQLLYRVAADIARAASDQN